MRDVVDAAGSVSGVMATRDQSDIGYESCAAPEGHRNHGHCPRMEATMTTIDRVCTGDATAARRQARQRR